MSLLCKKRGSKVNKLSKNLTDITDIYSLSLSKGDSWLQLTHSSNYHSIESNIHTWYTRTQRKHTQNPNQDIQKHAGTYMYAEMHTCSHTRTSTFACLWVHFVYLHSFHNSEHMYWPTKYSQTPLKVLVLNDTSSPCPFREHEWCKYKYTHKNTHS